MITISARVDDTVKEQAEQIAEGIGLNLSSIINVFLRRFVMEQGFPFDVKLPARARDIRAMSASDIEQLVQEGVRSATPVPNLPPVTLLDSASDISTPIVKYSKKEKRCWIYMFAMGR